MGLFIFPVLAFSLVSTLVLEMLFTFVAGVRNKKDMCLVVLVNVLTNPFVVTMFYLNRYYVKWNATLVTAVLEIGAVLVEGIYYNKYENKIKHPYLLSLGANVFSYFTGVIVNYLIYR